MDENARWQEHDLREIFNALKCSKVHIAVDALGNLLASKVTPANEPEREQAAELQKATNYNVELAFVDRGYTGDEPAKEV